MNVYTTPYVCCIVTFAATHFQSLGLQTCHFTVGGWITHKDILASRFEHFCNAYRNVQEAIIGNLGILGCTPCQL